MSENHSKELVFVFLQETKTARKQRHVWDQFFNEIDNLQVNGAEVDGVIW